MANQFLQGKYSPSNPEKYKGDRRDIVYRSSWELVAFRFCDHELGVIAWSSETVVIPYRGVDGLMHRYFVDLWIAAKQEDGMIKKFLVEIKPAAKMNPPRRGARKREDVFMREVIEYRTNQLKWQAAREYCRKNGWGFLIWTEAQLFPNQGKFVSRKKKVTKKVTKI